MSTPTKTAFDEWKKTPDFKEAMAVDLKKMTRERLESIAFAAFVAGAQWAAENGTEYVEDPPP